MAQGRRARKQKGRSRGSAQIVLVHATSPVVKTQHDLRVRGVKLRTVSVFTMLFALACLAAFMAGRPPVSAANTGLGKAPAPNAAGVRPLGHDDARSFLGSGTRRQRKAGPQKFQKGAGTRTPIHFLLADPQKKDQEAEHIGVFQS